MKLLSVNVYLPQDIVHLGKIVTTRILKEPVRARVRVGALGLDGDGQADRNIALDQHDTGLAQSCQRCFKNRGELRDFCHSSVLCITSHIAGGIRAI